jgi:hypothetical protein
MPEINKENLKRRLTDNNTGSDLMAAPIHDEFVQSRSMAAS